MIELIRETAFGQIVRQVSGKRLFKYPEEVNPELWKRMVDEKKSGYLAHHGSTQPPEGGAEINGSGGVRTRDARNESGQGRMSSESSSGTRVGSDDANINGASGVPVDKEKGMDANLVTWYDENDPENPQNWSTSKKVFVTGQICLLTTSVYIGSSIYSAGTTSVTQIFGVSQVAAVLGLTLFVAGYGLGPMIWVRTTESPL